MIWQLLLALFIAIIVVFVEFGRRLPWTPGLGVVDVILRLIVFVPWLLGFFALVGWCWRLV